MATVIKWADYLAEAQIAMHKLMTGTHVVTLESPDGTRVEYQDTDPDKLWNYIAVLQGKANDEARGITTPRLGPVYITP